MTICWRAVETQEQAATREITQTADDQQRLESLLDLSKPTVPDDCEGLSYLLYTPFRYPPLLYGSRLGGQWERGIFYGSAEWQTALAESAVYLWLFQQGLTELGPMDQIRDQRTLFAVKLHSSKAIDLTHSNWLGLQSSLNDPSSWSASQSLGAELRQLSAEFALYPSARRKNGVNAAVFSPKAFSTPVPDQQEAWSLLLNQQYCWFGKADGTSIEYCRSDFEVDGKIPHPCL